VLVGGPGSGKPYDLALVTTDLNATAEQIVERYAARWPIEQTIKDSKDLLGTGQAQNRVQTAVERTVPFQMLCLTILILWYASAGQPEADLAARRAAAPWYWQKRHVSVTDMLTAFRRARITGIPAGHDDPSLFEPSPMTWERNATRAA